MSGRDWNAISEARRLWDAGLDTTEEYHRRLYRALERAYRAGRAATRSATRRKR